MFPGPPERTSRPPVGWEARWLYTKLCYPLHRPYATSPRLAACADSVVQDWPALGAKCRDVV